MLILMVLILTLPALARADEYDTEIRMLDLELSMLYLRQQANDAEMRAASVERKAEIDAIFAPPSKPSYESRALDMDPSYIPPPEEPSRSMRPPWLQPVDPMIPMLPEDRARMHCLGPRDCYLNQTGREGF
jgi:hypothetical protein